VPVHLDPDPSEIRRALEELVALYPTIEEDYERLKVELRIHPRMGLMLQPESYPEHQDKRYIYVKSGQGKTARFAVVLVFLSTIDGADVTVQPLAMFSGASWGEKIELARKLAGLE